MCIDPETNKECDFTHRPTPRPWMAWAPRLQILHPAAFRPGKLGPISSHGSTMNTFWCNSSFFKKHLERFKHVKTTFSQTEKDWGWIHRFQTIILTQQLKRESDPSKANKIIEMLRTKDCSIIHQCASIITINFENWVWVRFGYPNDQIQLDAYCQLLTNRSTTIEHQCVFGSWNSTHTTLRHTEAHAWRPKNRPVNYKFNILICLLNIFKIMY